MPTASPPPSAAPPGARRRPRWRGGAAIALGAALVVAGLLAVDMRTRQVELAQLEAMKSDALLWHVGETQRAVSRLVAALSGYEGQPGAARAAGLWAAFDSLRRRMAPLQEPSRAAGLAPLDAAGAMTRAAVAVRVHERAAQSPEAVTPGDREAMLRDMRTLENALTPLIKAALAAERARLAAAGAAIRESNRLGAVKLVVTLAAALAVVVLVLAQARMERIRLGILRARAARAREAAAARSRFLTMMSHELRTPMNGVVGALALIERTGVAPGQRALFGHARASALGMVGLIEDVLELADIEDGRVEVGLRDATLDDLAEDVRRLVAARRPFQGDAVEVPAPADGARVLRLNRDCLAKAAALLALFCLDRLRASRVTVGFARGRDVVAATIRAEDPDRAGWDAETLFGPPSGHAIGGEAAGPAIARRLIRRMRGRGFLRRDADGAAVIEVVAPARLAAAEIAESLAAFAAEAAERRAARRRAG